jgi:hypothetical protein
LPLFFQASFPFSRRSKNSKQEVGLEKDKNGREEGPNAFINFKAQANISLQDVSEIKNRLPVLFPADPCARRRAVFESWGAASCRRAFPDVAAAAAPQRQTLHRRRSKMNIFSSLVDRY